jgi:hypothetical protein
MLVFKRETIGRSCRFITSWRKGPFLRSSVVLVEMGWKGYCHKDEFYVRMREPSEPW